MLLFTYIVIGSGEGLIIIKTFKLILMIVLTLSLSFAAGALLKKTLYFIQPVIDRL